MNWPLILGIVGILFTGLGLAIVYYKGLSPNVTDPPRNVVPIRSKLVSDQAKDSLDRAADENREIDDAG